MSERQASRIRKIHHTLKDRVRDFKIVLFRLIFDKKFSTSVKGDGLPILVLRLDNKIGDSIAATGFLRELKKNNNDSKLIVLAGKGSDLIYRKLSFVDEVISVKKGFFRALFLYFKLAGTDFKYIINTSHILSPRVIFLCSLLRASKKATFLNHSFKLFSHHVVYDQAKDHVTERYFNTLKAVESFTTDSSVDYEINLDAVKLKEAQAEIIKLREQYKKIVILNSFAGARFRNLNKKTTEAIVSGLVQDKDLVVISIGNHNDLQIAEGWIAKFASPQWISFAGAHDLNFNFALVKLADLVITPDTAIVHVASAFKKDLVCVYREDLPTSSEKNSLIWAPYKTTARIIRAPADPSQPEEINTLSPAEIVAAAKELLD